MGALGATCNMGTLRLLLETYGGGNMPEHQHLGRWRCRYGGGGALELHMPPTTYQIAEQRLHTARRFPACFASAGAFLAMV